MPKPNLTKQGDGPVGSVDACAKDFMATATMRGIGWVICYEEIESGLFINAWINEHDVGHLGLKKFHAWSWTFRTCLYDQLPPASGPTIWTTSLKIWEVVGQRLETT